MQEDVITHYKLYSCQTPDVYTYICTQKGIYGLLQAGIIAKKHQRNTSMHRGTIKAQSHLVSGNMTGDPSPLPYV
ncbi:hypothetical protein ACHAW6_014116 [Cyclotella cf. meneghiniana]